MTDLNGTTQAALEDARTLVSYGVPVFTCRLTSDGDPIPPSEWQKTEPDPKRIDRWKPGMGLCAVTGTVYDVLDVDPRNGGRNSFRKLSLRLGEDGPQVFWSSKTPSGGVHVWIGCLGMGSHNKIMRGLDLKGGDPDGSSRGFVFIPPTVRPSKETGERNPYQATMDLQPLSDDPNLGPIHEFLRGELDKASAGSNGGPVRQDARVLAKEAQAAEAGGQREALLRYVHELERKGIDEDRIIRMCISLELTNFNKRKPWTWKDFRSLLHKPGTITPDATPEEARELAGLKPLTTGLIRWAHEQERSWVSWLWEEYIAFGELTLVDGEKGVAKSAATDAIVACATRGLPFPGTDRAVSGPINVIYFTDEGTIGTILIPRLDAAGVDRTKVAYQGVPKLKKGQVPGSWDVALPEGAGIIKKMIAEADAGLAIFDPITDLLGEGIRSHEDASVRRALRPLGNILSELGCAGWMIRHMNKDTKADARYRGSGSTAYQNRSRIHLVAVEIPDYQRMSARTEGRYALGMVDTNLTPRRDGALTYSVIDSDIPLDEHGRFVGKVRWDGWADINVIKNEPTHRGPKPSPEREELGVLLEGMFSEKDTWPAREVVGRLQEAGIKMNDETIRKVTRDMGIRRERARDDSGALIHWVWTTKKLKASRKG